MAFVDRWMVRAGLSGKMKGNHHVDSQTIDGFRYIGALYGKSAECYGAEKRRDFIIPSESPGHAAGRHRVQDLGDAVEV
jgi:hypothetical protein